MRRRREPAEPQAVDVLTISPYPIMPLTHGGRVRTYQLATSLARAGAHVEILCPWLPAYPLGSFSHDGVIIHPHRFAANVLPFLLRGRAVPSLVGLSWQPYELGPRQRLERFSGVDVLEFHFCAHGEWMRRAPRGAMIVYVAHNVEFDYLLAQPGWLLRRSMLSRLAKLERNAFHASDLVVTCTEADASRLVELYGKGPELAVIPNGSWDELIDARRSALRDRARSALGLVPDDVALLFIGGPAAHNREAVGFLERHVVPYLEKGVRLLVVGACSNYIERSDAAERRVQPLGFVSDLRAIFAAADIGLNPVTQGSGSNIKVAEYLGAGLQVVTTPFGARGYEAWRERLTVSDLDAFSDTIRAVAKRRSPQRSVPDALTWSAIGRQLHDVYSRSLERKRGRV